MRITTKAAFRFFANGQQVFGLELSVNSHDTIIKPHVVLIAFHVHWLCLIIRRETGELGLRKKLHERNGPITKVLPVSLVRPKGNKDGFSAHDFYEKILRSPPFEKGVRGIWPFSLLPSNFFHPIDRFGQSIFGRGNRHPNVPFTWGAKAIARRGHDSGLF